MLCPKSLDFAMDDGELSPGDNDEEGLDAGDGDSFNNFNWLAAYVDMD